MQDEDIDSEVLISLVEDKPEIWDRRDERYKDRNKAKEAWKVVCCQLNEGFNDLNDADKIVYMSAVTKRWHNLRDSYTKRRKMIQESTGGKKVKKYIYSDQLQFLNKVLGEIDSLDGQVETSYLDESSGSFHRRRRQPKRKHETVKSEEVDVIPLTPFENATTNSHLCFFQGILPHLNHFDGNELLEFQMGVLQLIATIKNSRDNIQP